MDKKEIYSKLLHSTIAYNRDSLYDKVQRREAVRHLIELGADVNYNSNGYTLLHYYLDVHDIELIKILLEAGINIDAKDKYDQTALFRAADRSDFGLVQFLVENGADIYTRDNNGLTILQAAAQCYSPCRELIKFLIDKGLDINATDKRGNTPLHFACEYVSIEEPDFDAMCPRTEEPDFDAIKLLIELGADINAKNNEGLTPSDILEERMEWHIKENYGKEILNLLQGEKNG